MKKERLLSMDMLRVMSAVAIILIHVSAQSYYRIDEIGYHNWLLGAAIGWMMIWGTGNFLMISGGLLLNSSQNNWKEFYKKRVAKLAIPLLTWNVIYYLFSSYIWGDSLSFWVFFNRLWTRGTYYHLYFLNVMIGLYAITPLLKKWIRREWLDYLVPFLALAGMIYVLGTSFLGWIKFENIFTWFIPYMGYYLGGYWLLEGKGVKNKKVWLVTAGLVLLFNVAITRKLVFVLETHEMDTVLVNRLSLGVVVAGMMIYRTVTSIKNESLEKYRKIILGLSEMSMGMYLIHPLWVEFFKMNKSWMGLMSVNFPIWISVYSIAVIGLTIGSCYLLKKIAILNKII